MSVCWIQLFGKFRLRLSPWQTMNALPVALLLVAPSLRQGFPCSVSKLLPAATKSVDCVLELEPASTLFAAVKYRA